MDLWLVESATGEDDYGLPSLPVLLAVCTSAERAEELRAGAYGGRAQGITSRQVVADEYLSD